MLPAYALFFELYINQIFLTVNVCQIRYEYLEKLF